jgi:hypothetical protein
MTTLRLALSLLAPLAACGDLGERAQTGDCPAGEVCSDDTPRGLHFDGPALGDAFLSLGGPHPTLAGGTQQLRLTYDDSGTGFTRPLDRPYLADDEGGAGVEVERTSGAVVTLRGVSSRTNYLRITDPDGALYDRKQLEGATFTGISLGPKTREQVLPGDSVVFAPGTLELTVALSGRLEDGRTARVVDESLAIAAPGAIRSAWDSVRLPALTVGIYTVTARAGDHPEAARDVEVVAAADSIVAHAPAPLPVVAQASVVCFSARAAGRHVAGLAWTFATDNGTTQAWLTRNCAIVVPEREGALTVTARAGGQLIAAPLTVAATAPPAAAARSAAATSAAATPEPSSLRTSAGERAAAF